MSQLNTTLIKLGAIVSYTEGKRLISESKILVNGIPALDLTQQIPDTCTLKVGKETYTLPMDKEKQ